MREAKGRGVYFIRLHDTNGAARVAVGNYPGSDPAEALKAAFAAHPELFAQHEFWRVEMQRLEVES